MRTYRYLAVGPLPPPIGGDTISFSRLVENRLLREAGIQLEIIDTSRKEKESRLVRRLDWRDLCNAIRIAGAALFKRNTVDGMLIWANNRFAYTIGLVLILLFHFFNKRLILKLFGGDFAEEFGRLPRWFQRLAMRIFSKVDVLLPQTKQLCRYFTQVQGVSEAKVVHFPNFLPFEPIAYTEKPVIDKIRTVFVGQIRTEKGVFDILEAMKQVPGMSCTFYGPIFRQDRERFFQLLAELPEASYGGILAQKNVVQTIAGYDLLLLPSYHPGEGYPAVIVEAFFASVPVVASQWRMIPELVHHGENGFLVNPRSPEEIAFYVEKVLQTPALHAQLSAAAGRTAQRFTEQRVIGDILLPLLGVGRGTALQDLAMEKGG
ncbi:glycosyltransferase family 4 protein [Brevibacillus migulae]|uniref:glycosyltransferase family 4 protein n=1 Tax=Brevibacillus migulae TaxID=1644114 RepID=UPI00106E23F0|nr:glycosyltransferase family 4 protein [Brevibacillus migulae]